MVSKVRPCSCQHIHLFHASLLKPVLESTKWNNWTPLPYLYKNLLLLCRFFQYDGPLISFCYPSSTRAEIKSRGKKAQLNFKSQCFSRQTINGNKFNLLNLRGVRKHFKKCCIIKLSESSDSLVFSIIKVEKHRKWFEL